MKDRRTRWWTSVLFCASLALPAAGQELRPPRSLDLALDAVRQENWETAVLLSSKEGAIARDIILWHAFRAGEGTAPEVISFLSRHSDWPGIPLLKTRTEKIIANGATDAEILQFFQSHTPDTGEGALAYANALTASGDMASATAVLTRAWLTLDLDEETHDAFIRQHSTLLAPYHTARMNRLLWDKAYGSAGRMMALVDADWRALAAARIALQTDKGNVTALINAVPNRLGGDAGLSHDRFQWRISKGFRDSARDLLLERSERIELLGEPEAWANYRRILTRREMREGTPALAYRLAANHHLTEGSHWADLEWLSGYIALQFLHDPARALEHFKALAMNVDSPISKGRAGYWIGRAYEALGDLEASQMAFEAAALHQTSFYGLLAAERAGVPFDESLSGGDVLSNWRAAPFTHSDLFEAAVLLISSNERSLAERFIIQMAETLPELELVSLGDAMIAMGEPHLAVMVGKEAASRGIVLPRAYYALHPLISQKLPISTEWALAISRRESEFDPWVVSHVGARGLMQLMPKTAQAMAKETGQSYRESELLSDPAYNARLGSAYLAKLSRQFGGNPMFMAAGYNAGPSRPESWIEQFGDPRSGAIDVVDWVEMIPFRETRNYVMRVTESLPIYRARLGRDALPLPFSQELAR